MSNISLYPMQDFYETKLSQSYNGAGSTMYVKATPSFTFPSGMKTAVVINPGKTTQQVVIIDGYNAGTKTLSVSSTTVNRGPGVAYTAQTHPVDSVVRISNSFAFFEAIVESINSKVNTNDNGISLTRHTNTVARDAYITSPVSGKNWAYIEDRGLYTKYIAGSWQDDSTGATANASATVAGKVEMGTVAQGKAGTKVGETGADLVLSPNVLADVVQSGAWLYAGASAAGTDTYAVTMTPACTAYVTGMQIVFKADVVNTGACTINVNGLGAKSIKLIDGNDPSDGQIAANQLVELTYDGTNFVYIATPTVATSAMVTAGTNQGSFVTPYLLRAFANPYTVTAGTTTLSSATTTQAVTATSYTKVKEIQITVAGTYTTQFTLTGANGRMFYGRVYKNGVALGTQRTNEVGGGSWGPGDFTFTEDFTFAVGDLVQVYAYRATTDFTGYIKDYYLKGTLSQNPAIVAGVVILN